MKIAKLYKISLLILVSMFIGNPPTVLIHRCRFRLRERNICEVSFCKSLNRLGYNKNGLVSKNIEYIK